MIVVAAQLRRLVALDGGFTIDLRSGQPLQRGISVCTRPASSITFPWHEWDDDGVAAWIEGCVAALRSTATCVGGWLDPRTDQVWLDVVSVVAPAYRAAACELARTLRQHGVWDLDRSELVELRGLAS